MLIIKKVKRSRYRPGVAQRVGRGIALLFHGRGTRRGWVVSSTLRPHFTPGKDMVPILQEAGWAPGPVWMGEKSRPHRDLIPDRPARSQSLYRLSYPAHYVVNNNNNNNNNNNGFIIIGNKRVKILKDKNSISQTHHLLYGGYMFRHFIGSSSGLLLNQVSECCIHVGIPTMLTNSRNIIYLTILLHKI